MSIKYVEYLESTGDQHIPLKLDFTNNTRIVMDMMVKSTLNSYFLGNAPKGLNKIGNKIGFVGMTGTASNPSYGTLDVRTVMDYTLAGKLYFDGEEVHDFTNEHADYDTENPAYKVAVFGKDDNFEATGFRLYELKWYEGDELILHLKPCVDNGVGCLYDLVSETYYRCEKATYEPFILGRFIDALYLFANNNEGTAENLGSYRLYNMKIEGDSEGVESGINYVDYIYGDRTNDCRLDTGLPFTKSNKYVMGVNIIDSNSYSTFTGGFNYNWVTNRLEYGGLNVYPTWTNGGEGYFKNSWTTVGNEIVFDNGVLSVNGVPSSNVNTPFDSDATGNNQVINLRYARLRYFRVYDKSGTLIQELLPCVDNEGISCVYDTVAKKYIHASNGTISHKKTLRDFQPVLDSNGVPCLMDKVNKKYYYDKNGKGFGCAEQDEYKRIGYIQSDNNSWIDTGIYVNPQYKIELVFEDLTEQTYETFFSVDNVSELRFQREGKKIVINYNGQRNATYQFNTNTKYKLILNKNLVHLNDEIIYTFTEDTSTTNYPTTLKLWKIDKTYPCDYKLYSFKMWNENSELVLDLIPVLDNEGTPCMYDLVTETFFYNQGTGEFSYGIEEDECPKANYVEYISSYEGGFRRIPLDFSLYSYNDTNMSYEYKATFNQRDNVSMPIGTIRVATDKQIPIYFYRGASRNLQIRCGNANVQEFNFANANVGNTYVLSYNTQGNQEILANGKNVGTLDITGTMKSTDNLVLFDDTGVNSWTNANRYWQGDFYYFKMWYNGNLIHEILPCLDDNGEVAVYDTVTNKLYQQQVIQSNNIPLTSVGSSYNPIKYIETNGTQYIDTGVIVNDNTYMDIDYRAVSKEFTQVEYLQGDGDNYLNIGDWTFDMNTRVEVQVTAGTGNILCNTLTTGTFYIARISQGSLRTMWNGNTVFQGGQWFDSGINKAIVSTLPTETVITHEGTDYTSTSNITSFSANLNLQVFGQNTYATGAIKIHYLQIYQSEILVFDGIPVLDNEGTPCMYDKVSKQFFYNKGTGTFAHGNVVDKNYLMNDFYTQSTYRYNETDTTVEPNLTASAGATLTLGSTYMAYLSEEELEQATKNGWIVE